MKQNKMGWRRIVQAAMGGLPNQRGAVSDIKRQVEQMPDLIGRLDCSVSPSTKGVSRWHHSVYRCLSNYPEFHLTQDTVQVPAEQLRHSNAHRAASVWEYNPMLANHLTHHPKGKPARNKKPLDYIKAFRK